MELNDRMDMRFSAFDRTTAEATALPGFAALVAVLGAAQSSGRTAQIATRLASARALPGVPVDALAMVFGDTGDRGWGAVALGGCFHPAVAATLSDKGM